MRKKLIFAEVISQSHYCLAQTRKTLGLLLSQFCYQRNWSVDFILGICCSLFSPVQWIIPRIISFFFFFPANKALFITSFETFKIKKSAQGLSCLSYAVKNQRDKMSKMLGSLVIKEKVSFIWLELIYFFFLVFMVCNLF